MDIIIISAVFVIGVLGGVIAATAATIIEGWMHDDILGVL